MTRQVFTPGSPGLLDQLNRSVRRRVFDTELADLRGALYQYELGLLHPADLVTILEGKLKALRALGAHVAVDAACSMAARALYEGLLEEAGAVVQDDIDRVLANVETRLRVAVEEDLVPPESDAGTEFANSNSKTRDLDPKPEVTNSKKELGAPLTR